MADDDFAAIIGDQFDLPVIRSREQGEAILGLKGDRRYEFRLAMHELYKRRRDRGASTD